MGYVTNVRVVEGDCAVNGKRQATAAAVVAPSAVANAVVITIGGLTAGAVAGIVIGTLAGGAAVGVGGKVLKDRMDASKGNDPIIVPEVVGDSPPTTPKHKGVDLYNMDPDEVHSITARAPPQKV